MKFYDKLIRDNIPKILDEQNIEYEIDIIPEKEMHEYLMLKLQEEVNEYIEYPCTNEIIDILEILYSLIKIHNTTKESIEVKRNEKLKKRGGFNNRILLKTVKE